MFQNKILHWSYRDFRKFPEIPLNSRDSCEEIYLKENFIQLLPKWLFEMENLTFIHLSGNEIITVPDEISCLINLGFLDLSDNLIKTLPKCIGELRNLKRLNIGQNHIEELPKEIGKLKQLEILIANRNVIFSIPHELGDCENLIELSLEDNFMIKDVPGQIFNLKKLEKVSIDKCSLYHLPYVKCTTLTNFKICENYMLTHIPYYYENFITKDYAEKNDFHLRFPLIDDSLIQIETIKEKRIIVLPNQLTTVFHTIQRIPLSLSELSLGSAHKYFRYKVFEDLLPPFIDELLRLGPIARCGGAFCDILLFRECYLLLVRRKKRNDFVIISHLFCSKDCLEKWYDEKSCFYTKIEWKFIF